MENDEIQGVGEPEVVSLKCPLEISVVSIVRTDRFPGVLISLFFLSISVHLIPFVL